MDDIRYKMAEPGDAEEIAALHALSWQRHYRGIYTDAYLDKEVVNERRKVWLERFAKADPNRQVIKAVEASKIIGFACTFLKTNEIYGTLVDNLHVLQEYQGRGIGRTLLNLSARWVAEQDPESGIYLYVLKENLSAAKFYANLGATMSEPFLHGNPMGSDDEVIRCSWDTQSLIQTTS